MKKEKKVWAIVIIACWWLAPGKMNAQQDSLGTVNLDEIVVTATRFPKNQGETGKVLTVIDQEQLQRSAGKDLAQILNEQPGLVVNGANSNPGKDKAVYLRGTTNAYTLILLDGIPVNDPSGISGGAYDLRLLPIDQVERIEILKGSQSTLYGSDAIAGVINIITKNKADKPVEIFGTAAYGSYRTFRGNAGVQGSAGIVDYQLAYNRFSTEGFSEAREAGSSGTFDKDGASQQAFQANVTLKPVKTLSVKPYMRYSDFEGKYDAGALTDDVNSMYQGNLLNLGATGRYDLQKGSVNFLYGFDKTTRHFKDTYGENGYEGRFQNADLFVNQRLTQNFDYLAGINFQQWKMLDTTAVEKNPDVTLSSGYLSFFYHDGNGLAMELGGRYNQHSQYGNNFTYSANPSYFIDNKVKLFVNYSTGFKAPSLYQLYGLYGANPDLKPEKSNTLEGGLQWFSPEKTVDIRVVAFARQVQDVIVYAAGRNVNYDEQHDRGFEVEPNFRWRKFSVRTSYAFVTGEVTKQTGGNRDTTYQNLIRRPKHSFGANVGYDLSKNFSVSLNLKWFGQRQDIYFDLSAFETKTATLHAYTLLDLHGHYRINKYAGLFLDLRNVLNQDYEEVFGYNTMGFNFTAGISLKF